MKRLLSLAVLACLLVTPSITSAQGLGWTLSGSAVDVHANTGVAGAPGTLTTLYLHYACNYTPPNGPGTGMTAMEADLSAIPLAPIAVLNGFLNAGTANEKLLLVVGGCPGGPLVAGSLLYLETGVGLDVCLVPSADNGFNLTVDCGGTGWDNTVVGFNSMGQGPCDSGLCGITSVSERSWSGIKSLYR
jgi:hypothetical protein